MTNIYLTSMEIGNYWDKMYYDDITAEWSASVECATITKAACDLIEMFNCSVKDAVDAVMDLELEYGIHNVDDHMWDDYYRGFVAGQLIGAPNTKTLKVAKEAEKIYNDDTKFEYGYYQDIVEKAKENYMGL